RLGALDRGGARAGSEDGQSRGRKLIGEARDERRLRPDHDQVDTLAPREVDERLVRVDADRDPLRVAGDPRIAGRPHQRVGQRALGDLPGQRVLASAAADQENLDGHWSGDLEAGLDRGWAETGAAKLRTPDPSLSVVRLGFAVTGRCPGA